MQGSLEGSHLRGWNGNSSDTTPQDIIQNISVVTAVEDCPDTRVLIEDTYTERQQFVKLAFKVYTMDCK